MMGRMEGFFFHSSSPSTLLLLNWVLRWGVCTFFWCTCVRLSNRRCRRIDDFCVVVWGSSLPTISKRGVVKENRREFTS